MIFSIASTPAIIENFHNDLLYCSHTNKQNLPGHKPLNTGLQQDEKELISRLKHMQCGATIKLNVIPGFLSETEAIEDSAGFVSLLSLLSDQQQPLKDQFHPLEITLERTEIYSDYLDSSGIKMGLYQHLIRFQHKNMHIFWCIP